MRSVQAMLFCSQLLTGCASPTPKPQRLPTRAPGATPTARPSPLLQWTATEGGWSASGQAILSTLVGQLLEQPEMAIARPRSVRSTLEITLMTRCATTTRRGQLSSRASGRSRSMSWWEVSAILPIHLDCYGISLVRPVPR